MPTVDDPAVDFNSRAGEVVSREEMQLFHAVALLLAQEGQLWAALCGVFPDEGEQHRVFCAVLERRRDLSRARRDQLTAEIAELERRLGGSERSPCTAPPGRSGRRPEGHRRRGPGAAGSGTSDRRATDPPSPEATPEVRAIERATTEGDGGAADGTQ